MIIVVTGGRDFTDEAFVSETLSALHLERPITLVVEGGQVTWRDGLAIGGADYLAHCWATMNGVATVSEKADWDNYGSRAGPIRNSYMLRKYIPAIVVAFPGGRGTADCVRKARNMNIIVKEFAPA